jgi:hypothetical protein
VTRCALTVLLSVVVMSLFARAASADKPVREPLPAQEDATYPAGALCDFPVLAETLQNNETITTFSDGRQRVTGALKIRLTNVDTGESLVVNASGPGWQRETETMFDVSGQGRWVLFQFPGDEPGPGIFLYRGNIHFVFDFATESVTVLSATGSSRNLCEDLA